MPPRLLGRALRRQIGPVHLWLSRDPLNRIRHLSHLVAGKDRRRRPDDRRSVDRPDPQRLDSGHGKAIFDAEVINSGCVYMKHDAAEDDANLLRILSAPVQRRDRAIFAKDTV